MTRFHLTVIGAFLTVFGFCVVDFVLTTLFFVEGTQFEAVFGNVTDYHFNTSLFDLWFLWIPRGVSLIILLAFVIKYKQNLQRKLKFIRFVYITFELLIGLHSLIKLLAFSENIANDEWGNFPFFWCLFTWNIVAATLATLIYVFVLERVRFTPKGGSVPLRTDVRPSDLDGLLVGTKQENELPLKIAKTRSLLVRLLGYCRREWRWYITGFTFLMIYSAGLFCVIFALILAS